MKKILTLFILMFGIISFKAYGIESALDITDEIKDCVKKQFVVKLKECMITKQKIDEKLDGPRSEEVYLASCTQKFQKEGLLMTGSSININYIKAKEVFPICFNADVLSQITGTVFDLNTPIQNANIIFQRKATGAAISRFTTTDNNGNFEIKLKPGEFNIIISKPGYEKYISTITVDEKGISQNKFYLNATNFDFEIKGQISSNTDEKISAFINLQGFNSETNKPFWLGQKTDENGIFSIKIPKGFKWKLIIKADGYLPIEKFLGEINKEQALNYTLVKIEAETKKLSEKINFNTNGSISDTSKGLQIDYTTKTFESKRGGGNHYIQTRITNALPEFYGTKSIGEKGFDLSIVDQQGNQITGFDDNLTINLKYYGYELVSTFSGIKISDLQNLQIFFFEESTQSWIPLETTVSTTGLNLTGYSQDTLIKNINNYQNLIVQLSAKSNHFTLFTSLVSTVVDNGSSGIGSGVVQTLTQISQFLGDTNQSIRLIAGNDINKALSITRDNQKINLLDILAKGTYTASSTAKNLVSFALGDILQTSSDGKIEIDLSGYSKLNIKPGSILKIAEVGKNSLVYENTKGEIEYDFTKKTDKTFQYKVKGKTSYATIRGTKLSVNSDNDKDHYNLIEGKIDIYNQISGKTISLNAGQSYAIYKDGKGKYLNGYIETSLGKIEADAYNAAQILYDNGITKIKPQDAPYSNTLKRWESALLIGRLAQTVLNKQQLNNNNCEFDDIKSLDKSIQDEIIASCKLGLFKGSNKKFSPENTISKGQIIMVIARLMSNDNTKELDASYDYMLSNKIIANDDRKTNAGGSISRKEIYLIINTILK